MLWPAQQLDLDAEHQEQILACKVV